MLDLLVEQPIIALIVAAIAGWVAFTETNRSIRVLLGAGAILAFGSWLPIVLGALVDPDGRFIGNAVGLGLLAVFGSLLGVMLSAVGLGIRAVRLAAGRRRSVSWTAAQALDVTRVPLFGENRKDAEDPVVGRGP